jgi:hypothetical protein
MAKIKPAKPTATSGTAEKHPAETEKRRTKGIVLNSNESRQTKGFKLNSNESRQTKKIGLNSNESRQTRRSSVG